jgi:hypothetical protein
LSSWEAIDQDDAPSIPQLWKLANLFKRPLALNLESRVFPVQGPPGAGKTYTGARMICALARERKTVGITANSHKVIRNLLDAVVVAAREQAFPPASGP